MIAIRKALKVYQGIIIFWENPNTGQEVITLKKVKNPSKKLLKPWNMKIAENKNIRRVLINNIQVSMLSFPLKTS